MISVEPDSRLGRPLDSEKFGGRLVLGALLCGGSSRRMGSDKARLAVGPISFIEHGIDVLAGVTDQVVLACGSEERYGEFDYKRVLDAAQNLGPLGGLAAVLGFARDHGGDADDLVAVLAIDLPMATGDVFVELARHARETGADVCLLETTSGLEPLFGVYRVGVSTAVDAALAAGERRMRGFHRGFGNLKVETFRVLSEGERNVAHNVNTHEDWVRLREEDK